MKSAINETRLNDACLPTSGGVEIELNPDSGETTYWGILCRTCWKLVAFDHCPYVSFGPGAASMTPGAVRCGEGHNHIYFPRDFKFISSAVPVSDATMRENREVYRAINSRSQPPRDSSHGERLNPRTEGVFEVPSEVDRPRLLSDARKEPQSAAKERWADWAVKRAN